VDGAPGSWPTLFGPHVMGVSLPPGYDPARMAIPVWRRLVGVYKMKRRLGLKAQISSGANGSSVGLR
jgi:hypothetical protein